LKRSKTRLSQTSHAHAKMVRKCTVSPSPGRLRSGSVRASGGGFAGE
jgi:hypothetical protein